VVDDYCPAGANPEGMELMAESSTGYRRRFPLSQRPSSAVEVTVNGAIVPPLQGANTIWTYDALENRVRFPRITDAPPPSARVQISYVPVCE
jgi:hypothetical protein